MYIYIYIYYGACFIGIHETLGRMGLQLGTSGIRKGLWDIGPRCVGHHSQSNELTHCDGTGVLAYGMNMYESIGCPWVAGSAFLDAERAAYCSSDAHNKSTKDNRCVLVKCLHMSCLWDAWGMPLGCIWIYPWDAFGTPMAYLWGCLLDGLWGSMRHFTSS